MIDSSVESHAFGRNLLYSNGIPTIVGTFNYNPTLGRSSPSSLVKVMSKYLAQHKHYTPNLRIFNHIIITNHNKE